MKYQSWDYRFDPIPVNLDPKSQTVPDMSFTPREILSKFSRGEKVPLGLNGVFDSEDDSDHLGDYDPMIFEDDPTRDPEFDFGDFVEEKVALEERRKASSRKRGKKISDSERKASADELSASDAKKRETTSVEAESSPSAKA